MMSFLAGLQQRLPASVQSSGVVSQGRPTAPQVGAFQARVRRRACALGWAAAVCLLVLGGLAGSGLAADPVKELTPEERAQRERKAAELTEQGMQLYRQGRYPAATKLLEQALDMRKALYPQDKYPQGHPLPAQSLNNLGGLLRAQGKYQQALPFFQQALDMRKALYPQDKFPQGHPDLALSLNSLGGLLRAQGEYQRALPLLQQALDMRKALYPQDKYPQGHPDLAENLNNIGFLLRDQGEYQRALPFLQQALNVKKALYPQDKYPQGHLFLAAGLSNLGLLLQAQGEYQRALAFHWQALAMGQDLATLFADAASEVEALNYLASLPLTRDAFLSLRHHLSQTPPDDVYAPIWRGKAALTRLLERRQQAVRAAKDPATRELADNLHSTRRQLARLLLAPAGDPTKHEQRLKDLTSQKEDLERQLARLLPSSVPQPTQDTASHTELVKHLPERTAFIDLLRYTRIEQDPKVPGKKGESRTESYVAFVLRPGQPAQQVELGPAKPIEGALADWRQAIADWKPTLDAQSRRRLDDKAGQAAEILRRRVWEPLAQHLPKDTQTVYLAPDRDLTRLPWAALPGTKPGTVLLEEYALAVVPHGPFLLQRLTAPPAADQDSGLLLAVGGVRYDEQPPPADKPAEETHLVRSAERGGPAGTWDYLPATLAEVQQVQQLAGKRTVLFRSGNQAGTTQLLADLPRARWAHLATHGFFAEARFRSVLQVDDKLFDYRGFQDRGPAGARNPLVLSGLVLAGANLPPREGHDPLSDDGGIVTAEALTGLDLDRLELAVLSACETGLGDVAGGEGVFGLQRALHLAGARNVVASLWKVPDQATAALMALFYHKLWREHKEPLVALREAQLTLYHHPERIADLAQERGLRFDKVVKLPVEPAPPQEPRASGKAAAKVWAGFVLSGPGW